MCVVVKMRLSEGILGAAERGQQQGQPGGKGALEGVFMGDVLRSMGSATYSMFMCVCVSVCVCVCVCVFEWGERTGLPSYPECTLSASRRQQNCSSARLQSCTFIRYGVILKG